jgi:hypothetical protein
MMLNVMVLENEPDAAALAEQELRDAGHTVLSCHDPSTAAFPCRGVAQPSACPLRTDAVDVALVVRCGTRAQPTLGEDGARCALVHRVPLVVAGTPLFDPFDEFASRTIDRTHDVVEACEAAAAAPIAAFGARSTAVLHDVLGPSSPANQAAAVVHRVSGRLDVRIVHGEAMTKDERSRAAVRIVMALRELDPFAGGIDVAVAETGRDAAEWTS